jgi:hypothetical protein
MSSNYYNESLLNNMGNTEMIERKSIIHLSQKNQKIDYVDIPRQTNTWVQRVPYNKECDDEKSTQIFHLLPLRLHGKFFTH